MHYCIRVFLLSILFNQAITDDILPIILIPGYSGSQIEAKLTNKPDVPHAVCEKNTKDFFNLWLNLEILVPIAVDCWADNMRMVYDNATHSTHSPEGVETRIPHFGDSFPVEYINPKKLKSGKYYADLADALVNQKGYVRNTNLRGAPFDFRKAPNDNRQWFDDMKKLTEDTYNTNGKKRVILIAHSMGGPMTLHFLQEQSQDWKDTHIAALISLAGAYGGTIKAVKLYTIGDDLGEFLINGFEQREVQMTWSSVAYLMPSPQIWTADEPFVEAFNKQFTVKNLPDFFANLSCPDCFDMWNDTEPFKDRFAAPGVEVHCLYGSGVQTVEKLVQNPDGKVAPPTPIFGDGDGTINLRSMQACLKWNGTQPQKFFSQEFPKTDHLQIINDKNIIQNIISIVEQIK